MCSSCDPARYYGQDDPKQIEARKKDREKLKRVRAAMEARSLAKVKG